MVEHRRLVWRELQFFLRFEMHAIFFAFQTWMSLWVFLQIVNYIFVADCSRKRFTDTQIVCKFVFSRSVFSPPRY